MQLQGIRITYFINGGIAIVWIFPILWMISDELMALTNNQLFGKEAFLVFIIPFIYLIGMLISYFARSFLNKPKRKIQRDVYSTYLGDERLYQAPLMIKIASSNKEIYARLEENLTAQLIARGTVLNLLLALPTSSIVLLLSKKTGLLLMCFPLLLFLLILSYLMWRKHQRGYYENQCYAYLLEKGVDILNSMDVQKYKENNKRK